ncbi:hypothetical protein NDU88_000111 [Pleurodeles waltl]|uniref:RRM domain-containing protein n=1 Tax=Pleurodeles waltl TaxID=8319 RepID=A0AAV7KPU6_PLEWA|nr:hypothetical protein NDU88_000111 [Pleurodeles waltl]
MGDRQALRIDYAHGTVPGTAFVIDEPFPITPCGLRVPAGGERGLGSGGGGSAGPWGEEPGPQRREEASWGGMDWSPSGPQSLFSDGGRFRAEDGAARRPNGSYPRRPPRGGPGPGGDLDDDGESFRGGPGQRPGMGGFRGRGPLGQQGGPGGRGRGGSPDDMDIVFRERGLLGQRGGPGGRGRSPEDNDHSFRGPPGPRGGFGGRGRAAEDMDSTFRGRGSMGQRGGFGGRERGADDSDGPFRARGLLGPPGGSGRRERAAGAEDTDGPFRARGPLLQPGAPGRRERMAGPEDPGAPFRARGQPGGAGRRERTTAADDSDAPFRARGLLGQPGGAGRRDRTAGADDRDGPFRARGPLVPPGGTGRRDRPARSDDSPSRARGPLVQPGRRGREQDGAEGASWGRGPTDQRGGRGPTDQRGGRGGRGRGSGQGGTDKSFQVKGPLVQPGKRAREQQAQLEAAGRGQGAPEDSGVTRGGPGGLMGRGRGRGAVGEEAPATQQQGKPFTPKPVSKHATPGKILTSQIPPLIKHPPVSKFRNRFPGSDDSSPSPSPPPGAKSNSLGPKGAPQAVVPGSKSSATQGPAPVVHISSSEATDSAIKKPEAVAPTKSSSRNRSPGKSSSRNRSPGKSSSRNRSPGKSSSRNRSPGKSSSRNRSPGKSSSNTRSSSKGQSRRSRSRSRRRSRSPRRHRSRSRSPHKRRSRSPQRQRSPYRPMSALPGEDEGYGIRVIGFPVRASDRTLQDGLYHEFKRHGKIISVDMHGCAEDRYAIIFYQNSSEREAALTAFKGHCFFGRPVHMEPWDSSKAGSAVRSWEDDASFRPLGERADEFHPRATKILFVGNLEKTLTREDLNNVFQRFGEILGIDLKKMVGLPNRFAFIQFIDIASVCRAIKEMDGELLRNTRLRLGFGRSKPTNCLWVDGLPDTLTESQLTAHFSAHGTVLKLSYDPAKGVALVFFKTVEQAEAALAEARGQTVAGNRIKVDFANSRSQAAFYRVTEPGPDDGIDVEPEKEAPPATGFKPSDIEAGDVLRKVLLV